MVVHLRLSFQGPMSSAQSTRPKSSLQEKVTRCTLAGIAVMVPAFILWARFKMPRIDGPFAFISLSGVVGGRDPHLFARIMHDLTHPVFLACYAFVFVYAAMRSCVRPSSGKSGQLLFCGLALVHLVFLLSYSIALFLPIGDMVERISPR
jgi:hypothetical protein